MNFSNKSVMSMFAVVSVMLSFCQNAQAEIRIGVTTERETQYQGELMQVGGHEVSATISIASVFYCTAYYYLAERFWSLDSKSNRTADEQAELDRLGPLVDAALAECEQAGGTVRQASQGR